MPKQAQWSEIIPHPQTAHQDPQKENCRPTEGKQLPLPFPL